MRRGRPLRFLGAVVGGWTTLRVAMLWPASTAPALADASLAETRPASILPVEQPLAVVGVIPSSPAAHHAASAVRHAAAVASAPDETAIFPMPAATTPPLTPDAPVDLAVMPNPAMQIAPMTSGRDGSRLAVNSWLIARGAGGDNLAFGELGGSQAGARLTYALGEARRVALSARVSAPLRGRGAEAAVGIDWRPTHLPVHLLIEQRLPLDGGRARPAAEVIAGLAAALPLSLTIEAYAQTGAVARRGTFADGAARLARPVLELGHFRLNLGTGIWGAAQRGVARLDVGPSLGLTVPGAAGAVRLGLDYRFRLSGRARPGSGPALTLGGSF